MVAFVAIGLLGADGRMRPVNRRERNSFARPDLYPVQSEATLWSCPSMNGRTAMRARVALSASGFLLASLASGQDLGERQRRLKDPDAKVRRLAAEALGKQKAAETVPALAAVLKDPEAAVRAAAVDALVAIGPKAVPALATSLAGAEE